MNAIPTRSDQSPSGAASNASARPTAADVRRARRTAGLLFVLGFGPMLLATVMYYTGWLTPNGQTNRGELIQPPLPVAGLALQTADGEPLGHRFGPAVGEPQWLLLVVAGRCGADCEQLLYLTRQVNIALGKNANRVSRAALLAEVSDDLAGRWSEAYGRTERLSVMPGQTPAWPDGLVPASAPGVLLVDPHGNLVMRYGPSHTGKDILTDLKHLLKLSNIG
ncbi:hypothetical protein [Marinobacter sp. C2H3]|uniref:hypothetical protein n=1 Tax=Marinobacter sp. C2H3 TaxID=3119003 RepID=UPI00300E86EE